MNGEAGTVVWEPCDVCEMQWHHSTAQLLLGNLLLSNILLTWFRLHRMQGMKTLHCPLRCQAMK
jgi:hypothetical protein